MIVTFYKNCKIQPNHCIQDVMVYLSKLSTKESFTLTDSKAFKSDLDSFSVRVDLSGKSSDIYANYKDFNYCTIGDSTHTQMYFVTGWTNISQYIYEANVTIDVVNTYNKDAMDKDLFKQVSVKRRHKNRWYANGGKYFRKYDKVDEGLGNVSTYTTSVNKTTDVIYAVHKYLNTGSTDSENHVRNYIPGYLTYCVPKTTTTIHTVRYGGDIPFTTIFNKSSNYSYALVSGSAKTNLKLAVQPASGNKLWYYANAFLILFIPSNETFAVYGLTMQSNSKATIMNNPVLLQYGDGAYASLFADGVCSIKWKETTSNVKYEYGNIINPTEWSTEIAYYKGYETTVKSLGESNYNWANSEVKQVEELPCNLDLLSYKDFIDFGDDEIIIPANTDYLKTQMTFTVSATEEEFNKPVQDRESYYESKLYGSYVTTHSLAYDNFTLPVQLEYLPNASDEITVDFLAPLNLTNNYLIKIKALTESKLYSNVLVCQRSNTIPVLSDAALEYIQTGYNYDLKSQSLNNFKNGLNIASSATNIGLGLIAKGSKLGAVTALQGASSLASNITSVITSNMENELALSKKRDEVTNTAPSISGNSDLKYFDYYSGNNFKYTTSQPSQEVWDNIYDLFYFTGYADNLFYDTMPTIKTRQFFNYVQAEIGLCTISNPKEKQRLIQAYSEGITFEWQYASTWLMEVDYLKLYENWEIQL